MRRWLSRALAMGMAVLSTGLLLGACGPDAEDICEDLVENCPDDFNFDACVMDGQSLTNMAETAGCDDQLDDYLCCLGDVGCQWRTGCIVERDALEACGSPLPPGGS